MNPSTGAAGESTEVPILGARVPRRGAGRLFFLVFVLPWSLMSLGVTGLVLWQIARQVYAGVSFRQVSGIVVDNRIDSERSGRSTTFRPVVVYKYVIAGKEFTADRISFETWSSSDSSFAEEFVRARSVGATIPVYVDPTDPAFSVLRVGVQPQQLMFVLFLTPFLTITFAMWAGIWLSMQSPDATGGLLLHERPEGVVIGSRRTSILGYAGAYVLLSSFAMGGVSLALHQLNSSMNAMLALFGIVFVGAALVGWWVNRRNESGVLDIVINRQARTIAFGRRIAPTIDASRPFGAVDSVFICDRSNQSSAKSDLRMIVRGVAPDRTHEVVLLETVPIDQAERGAQWLCREFGFSRGQDIVKPDVEVSSGD